MTQLNWGELIKDAADTGSSLEPLPVGDYNFKVLEAEYKLSQNGKDMWKMTTEVLDGPHSKRRVWTNLVLTPDSPNALGMFFRKMGALGLNQDFFVQSPDSNTIARALVGRPFRGQVTQREWQGKIQNDINMMFPYVAPSSDPAVTAAAPAPAPAPALAPAPAVAPAPAYVQPVAPPAPAVPVVAPVSAVVPPAPPF